MIHGLDTGFLVAAEVAEHSEHLAARAVVARLIATGDSLALAPQVLAEFIHVVTDSRRFSKPLDMARALQLGEQWWTAREVVRVFPDHAATWQFLAWLRQFTLGRKRLLDTLLASTYRQAGVESILTTNPTDFAVFGVFRCITPTNSNSIPGPAVERS
jgi:predicted nucleic acid-binding protein